MSTFTRMNDPPTEQATASDARAALRRTLTPSGNPGTARRTSAATRVIDATVSAGTSSLKNGASPMFSTIRPSTPPSARASASCTAASTTASMLPPNPGEPGSGSSWTGPMMGFGCANRSVRRIAAEAYPTRFGAGGLSPIPPWMPGRRAGRT